MGLGNRRWFVVAVAAALAVPLAGCTSSAAVPEPAAEAIGTQALGFTSSGAAPTSTGWKGSQPCPASFQQNEQAQTPAGHTLKVIDPTTIRGVTADPDLFQGDVPSCTFELTVGSSTARQNLFYNMPESYALAMDAKLVADGFVPTAVTTLSNGTNENYFKGKLEVGTQRLNGGGIPIFVVIG